MGKVDLSQYSIVWACQNDMFFGPWFKSRPSWRPWLVFLKHLFGLPCSPRELAFIKERTGRIPLKRHGYVEAWLVVGRRGGKSFTLAVIAVYLTFFVDWKPFLAPGELATIIVIAQDRQQARVILRYVKGLIQAIKFFRRERKRITQWVLEFPRQRVAIEIFTASFRATRGYTVVAALCDEVAFWRSDDTSNPDEEIINAIRPGMATVSKAMLLAASSPYAKRGVLYKHYADYFSKDDPDVLIWHGPTESMNPSISQKYLARQYEKDPIKAAAEYGAQFRGDIEDFVPEEVVDALIERGVFRKARDSRITYRAFVDPSGGSQDSFTLAIGHVEGEDRVLDVLEEWKPPFKLKAVVKEVCKLCKDYGISRVKGDNYAGDWPKEEFKSHGITYEKCEKRKTDLYRDALPLLHTGNAFLLDNRKMKVQICSLERRLSRGGRFTIDHPPGGHDDLANAALGLAATLPARLVKITESDYIVGSALKGSETPMSNIGTM